MPYILVAALACALAVLFYIASLKMQPAAYETPRILVLLLISMAIAMVVDVFLYKRRSNAGAEVPSAPHLAPFFEGVHVGRVAVFVGAIVLYVALLEPVGYFIVTPLFVLGTLLFLRACRPWVAAVVAAAAPVFVYLVFVAFLDLPIPLGVME